MSAGPTHWIPIRTKISPLQHQRSRISFISRRVGSSSDLPTFATSLCHPIPSSESGRDGGCSVVCGSVWISSGGGEHGVGMTVGWFVGRESCGDVRAGAGTSGAVPVTCGCGCESAAGWTIGRWSGWSGWSWSRRSASTIIVEAPTSSATGYAVGLVDVAPFASLDV